MNNTTQGQQINWFPSPEPIINLVPPNINSIPVSAPDLTFLRQVQPENNHQRSINLVPPSLPLILEPAANVSADDDINLFGNFDNDFSIEPPEEVETFSANVIQMFQELYLTNITRKATDTLVQRIMDLFVITSSLVDQTIIDDSQKQTISSLFSTLLKLISTQKSDFKRTRQLTQQKTFIEPIPVCYGTTLCTVTRNYKSVHINKALLFYKIPLTQTLEALFDNNSFKSMFINQNHICEPGVYKNFCCGSLNQNSPLNGNRHIQIQLYFDTVSVADPLKQNASEYKLGCFYFRVLNLPMDVQSDEDNIHLLALFNENEVRAHSERYNAVLKLVKEMVSDIELNGIRVKINNIDEILKGTIAALAGDNLAIHQLTGTLIFFY